MPLFCGVTFAKLALILRIFWDKLAKLERSLAWHRLCMGQAGSLATKANMALNLHTMWTQPAVSDVQMASKEQSRLVQTSLIHRQLCQELRGLDPLNRYGQCKQLAL